MEEEYIEYTSVEFAKLMNITVKTLYEWNKKGLIKAHKRESTGRLFYNKNQLDGDAGKKRYTTTEFSLVVHEDIAIILNWDNSGVLKAHYTLGGSRYYTQKHIDIVEQCNKK